MVFQTAYTDCGTNYVGVAKQLKRFFDEASNQQILYGRVPCTYHFIPPEAPHWWYMGGYRKKRKNPSELSNWCSDIYYKRIHDTYNAY